MNGTGLLVLLYPTIGDIKRKKFYIEPIGVSVLCIVLVRVAKGNSEVAELLMNCLLGSVPGIFTGCVSRLTKEAIGLGDAAVITGLGIVVGWENVCIVCMMGLVLTAVVGVVMVLCNRANRKTKLPFVPFLTVAYVFLWVYRWRCG